MLLKPAVESPSAVIDPVPHPSARSSTRRGFLLVSVDFFPNLGGIAMMTHHLANALSEHGPVTVLAPGGASVPTGLISSYCLVEDTEARPLVREHEPARHEDERVRRLLSSLSSTARLPWERILLMHPFYYGRGSCLFARQAGLPLSVFFHGFELRSQLLARQNPFLRLRELWRGPLSLKSRTLGVIAQADELLCNSSYTARLLRTTGTSRPIHVTGCGLSAADLVREIQLAPVFERDLKRKERHAIGLLDLPTVAFVGRLVPSKNVGLLLRALSEVEGVAGLIVGNGPERDRLRSVAESLRLSSRLQWVPEADEGKKWDLLRASDVLCLPSKEKANGQVEGFGIVLLEAAATGTPVIAARSGGMTDVVEEGVTGLLCGPDEPATLAEAIRVFLSDDDLSFRCVDRARLRIRERFNWKAIAESLVMRWKALR